MVTANATQNADLADQLRDVDTIIEENLAKAIGILQSLLMLHNSFIDRNQSNAVWAAADLLEEAQAAFRGDRSRFRYGPETATVSAGGVGA